MSFYIKYSNDNWATETKVSFPYVVLDRQITSVKKEKGQTLRGKDYAHRLFSKTKRKVILSADSLTVGDGQDKIRAIWKAGALKYSPDDVTYTNVILENDGDYTPELIDDDEALEEFEFTLIYQDPD